MKETLFHHWDCVNLRAERIKFKNTESPVSVS